MPPVADETRELVQTITRELEESAPGPVAQIRRVVQRLGADQARAFLDETRQVEAQGGLLVVDGSRRRTPGGVYFHLVRQRVSAADRAFIFPAPWSGKPQQRRPATSAAPATPPLPAVGELPNATGEVRTVKITLIGRPGPTTTTRAGYLMTSMQSGKVPALPKGLPAPPTTPTRYTVYLTPKQWQKVADSLRNPDDTLIVEGYPSYAPSLEGMAVYATNVTTKLLQQPDRAARQAGA